MVSTKDVGNWVIAVNIVIVVLVGISVIMGNSSNNSPCFM